MSVPTLATIGGASYPVGFAGQLALLPGGLPKIESRFQENATAIDFGACVAKGVTAATAGTPGFARPIANPSVGVGLAVRSVADASTLLANGTVNYPQNSMVGVLTDGYMWVLAAENAVEGDTAVAVVATPSTIGTGGAGGGAGNGTTRIAIPGCVWKTTTAAGAIGLVSITTA